jgi:hypothetical protein
MDNNNNTRNSLFNLPPKSSFFQNQQKNYNLSPTPSQSWIEENIHSIIRNDDTFNDSFRDLDTSKDFK